MRLLRPHQWVKNLLVFVPLLLSHRPQDAGQIGPALLAFALFCLVASAGYVFNDLRDLSSDLAHPIKRYRPLAAGQVPVAWAGPLAVGLLVIAFSLAALLPPLYAAALGMYVLAAFLYSVWLKSRLLIDVIVLAGLYTLRLLAGGAATGVELTPWLLAFSMFIFLSLAFAKRHAELSHAIDDQAAHLKARGYRRDDMPLIQCVGSTSGCLSVLVLAIYLNSPLAGQLYHHPFLLWLICPILLYWITRIWFLARRGMLIEDPLMFALRDRVSWIAAVMAVGLVLGAAWLPR